MAIQSDRVAANATSVRPKTVCQQDLLLLDTIKNSIDAKILGGFLSNWHRFFLGKNGKIGELNGELEELHHPQCNGHGSWADAVWHHKWCFSSSRAESIGFFSHTCATGLQPSRSSRQEPGVVGKSLQLGQVQCHSISRSGPFFVSDPLVWESMETQVWFTRDTLKSPGRSALKNNASMEKKRFAGQFWALICLSKEARNGNGKTCTVKGIFRMDLMSVAEIEVQMLGGVGFVAILCGIQERTVFPRHQRKPLFRRWCPLWNGPETLVDKCFVKLANRQHSNTPNQNMFPQKTMHKKSSAKWGLIHANHYDQDTKVWWGH